MIVGRLLKRASSTAQFTPTVVVPEPPFAPTNAMVVARGRVAGEALRRDVARAIASWNVLSDVGHAKNSFAPARIACRMRSGFASTETMKIETLGAAIRSRSISDSA